LKSLQAFQLQKAEPLAVFLYSVFYWMTFQFLRFGTTGFVIVVFVQSMIVGVAAILLLRRKKPTLAARSTRSSYAGTPTTRLPSERITK
jgi:hypothetical protein